MSLIPAGSSLVREEESEETSETKLTEVTKDLGNTQMMEKGAEFHGTQSSKILEETGSSTQNVECSAKIEENSSEKSHNSNVDVTSLPYIYKPLEPIKKFEPLKPFEPLRPIEAPKSFELARHLEASGTEINPQNQSIKVDSNVQNANPKPFMISSETKFEATNDHTQINTPERNPQNEPSIKIDSNVQNANPKPFMISAETKFEATNNSQIYLDAKVNQEGPKPFEPLKPLELPSEIRTKQYEPLEPFELAEPEPIPKENLSNETKPVQEHDPVDNPNNRQTEPVEPIPEPEPSEPFELRTSTGEPYVPVIALEPLNLEDYLKPIVLNDGQTDEIKEDKIKNSLKEIISDLDTYAEKDKELQNDVQKSNGACNLTQDIVNGQEQRRQIAQELNLLVKKEDPDDENESSSKTHISLEKLFTPAEDAPQIQPTTNRKMFASSSFYAKGLHPTVEDQVELARRISSSLSDISNKTSKGQSMYVNRKKRSVKWVHAGEGQANGNQNGDLHDDGSDSKIPLKLVMNPLGHVQDINSLRKQGYVIESALSPDVCLEIVKDLNSPKGKGAELFAKRRKRSEKWVVGETNGTRQENLPDIAPTPTPILAPLPPISTLPAPSYLPETTQRFQHNQKLDQIQERFTRPKVKLIKSPWDAALETGSVDAAFENLAPTWPSKGSFVAPVVDSYEQALRSDSLPSWKAPQANGYGGQPKTYVHNPACNSSSINRIVDNLQKGATNVDVYKPKPPQAWGVQSPAQQQFRGSSTLPRTKSIPPPSPTFKATKTTPPVFIPKESTTPIASYQTQPTFTPQQTHQHEYLHDFQSTTPRMSFTNLQNYNTAARGWGGIKDVYRPITFDKPKSPFTDF